MKRLVFVVALLALTIGSSMDCYGLDGIFGRPCGPRGRNFCGPRQGNVCADTCPRCGLLGNQCRCGLLHGPLMHRNPDAYGDPGPPSASITYPYYTTRGPRDFFAKSPRGIGP